MKIFLFLCVTSAVSACLFAGGLEEAPFPHGKLLFEENMTQPLGKGWSITQGLWECKDGAWWGRPKPGTKHGPALHHEIPASDVVLAIELRFTVLKNFHISLNNEEGHIGRVLVDPDLLTVRRDTDNHESDEELMRAPLALQPNHWYTLYLQAHGDELRASVGGASAQGRHPALAKQRTSFAIGFSSSASELQVRNLRIWELGSASDSASAQGAKR